MTDQTPVKARRSYHMDFNVKRYGKLDFGHLTEEQRGALTDVAQEFVDQYEELVNDTGIAYLSTDFEGWKPGDVHIDVLGCGAWVVNVSEADMDAVCCVMDALSGLGERRLKILRRLGKLGRQIAEY
jgi:hypothetical protein